MFKNNSFYLILDSAYYTTQQMLDLAHAINGEIACVQLRMKAAPIAEIKLIASQLLTILRNKRIPLIINDHIELVQALDADGVHLGQTDFDCHLARSILGFSKIIGLSIENLEQAKQCQSYAVDYFGVGPIFATQTKHDAAPPIGLQQFAEISKLLSKPIVAIGGIQHKNFRSVLHCGATAIAPISAISSKPLVAIKEFLTAMPSTPPCVLTIAGSDSSGGAGIQADIKAISALQCYAASVVTAVTAQNTLGVSGIFAIPPEMVNKQMQSVISDLPLRAIKMGMLFQADIMREIIKVLDESRMENIVLDPVMISKSGASLLAPDAIMFLKNSLFPRATLITPNIDEAKSFLGHKITSTQDMEFAAKELGQSYNTNVLVKGGHLNHPVAADVLFQKETATLHWFNSERILTANTHGTGCTYSAAIAAYLASGFELLDAISFAKNYLTKAIAGATAFRLGAGAGPVNHFYFLRANDVI